MIWLCHNTNFHLLSSYFIFSSQLRFHSTKACIVNLLYFIYTFLPIHSSVRVTISSELTIFYLHIPTHTLVRSRHYFLWTYYILFTHSYPYSCLFASLFPPNLLYFIHTFLPILSVRVTISSKPGESLRALSMATDMIHYFSTAMAMRQSRLLSSSFTRYNTTTSIF